MADYIDLKLAKRLFANDHDYGLAKRLDEVPAADVVEVRHGRWVWNSIDNPLHRICNQCGAVYRIVEDDFPYNFCPNCGAKMRGEGP